MIAKSTQSRGGVKGGSPLQGQGTASLVGFGATPQLFRRRPTPKKKSTKGAGSEASLPVTLRVRRRAPKLHIRPFAHCRAKWARPTTYPSNPTTCRFSLAEIRFLRYDILIRKEVTPHG